MNGGAPADGAWIFLSHSHKDLDKVREVRNKHRPVRLPSFGIST